MAWFDKIPLLPLSAAAIFLGLAPFTPEPHLVEKLRMLGDGVLSEPKDIFDLVMHGGPAILVVFKILRMRRQAI